MSNAISALNPKAEFARRGQALQLNINAASGLQDVLRSNLGPRGTIKMLVSGSGDIKLTKDGKVLLGEMQIQNPTAAMIARAATAQDDITGDGTTSNVLLIGELLKQANHFLSEGLHPRLCTDGFETAKTEAIKFLNEYRIEKEVTRDLLIEVARTSLRTKLHHELADLITEHIVDSVLTIQREGERVDLFMVEIMKMMHRTDMESRLVKGLVLDHGARHPDMPKRLQNCYILTCNVSLEYEKTEINSGFFYSSAEERDRMVAAERRHTDDRVQKVIELKRKVCPPGSGKSFVLINQKGIDPLSLDMLAREGIFAVRRAKRRNMERMTRACGGVAVNSFDEMDESILGHAGLVYEHTLGEEKYTFVEEVENPFSCTLLIKGPNKHTLDQIVEAIRDGLRAVKNTIEDKSVVPGAGAFEVAAYLHLMKFKNTIKDKSSMGVVAFAQALLVVPKVLAQNGGHDPLDALVKVQAEAAEGHHAGIDVNTGEPLDPTVEGIWDNYRVKRQLLHSCSTIAGNLLLVDEMIRAGRATTKNGPDGQEMAM
ncbi:T-complex protein 1 subunit zeta [Fonticula alba]|uniref:T-complex protein 1 subunit zeta n=1 Tax=Fonticula alba TaxID=691883 RepID=A0A058ZBL9_FONAL|nr:T-complex protein 1 subunit zeta [Fonticula alba]KCV71326.1 T-complex protein 1 subunit zeta [Fonticula alba]|eukprot:XP_009494449.1 T-complex protein 1 subunit zeta [Fonticula alba]